MDPSKTDGMLRRYLNGTATPGEIAWVESWYLSRGRQLPKVELQIDYATKGDELWERIQLAQRPRTRKLLLWPRIAAAVLVVLGLGLGLYFSGWLPGGNSTKLEDIVYASDVAPGGQRAVLALGDGRRIALEGLAEGQVALVDGARISKDAAGRVVYQATGQGRAGGYHTLTAPAGGSWEVVLSDGSRVFLNALSSLRYPVRFTGGERRVELSGEGYFEVAKNAAMPFRVGSGGQLVEVLGTHFNVSAYAGEQLLRTTLLEGSVRVRGAGAERLLSPGQQSVYDGRGLLLEKDVDLEQVMAWHKGYFRFSGTLEEIMGQLARWYDIEVVYAAGVDKNKAFFGEISRGKNLSSVLRLMQSTGRVTFEIEGRRVLVGK